MVLVNTPKDGGGGEDEPRGAWEAGQWMFSKSLTFDTPDWEPEPAAGFGNDKLMFTLR